MYGKQYSVLLCYCHVQYWLYLHVLQVCCKNVNLICTFTCLFLLKVHSTQNYRKDFFSGPKSIYFVNCLSQVAHL